MTLALFAHPFSSYCQKVLTALYENGTAFELKMLGPEAPENYQALQKLWPLSRFPVLVDDGRAIIEASVIIEYLGLNHPGPVRLIPADPEAALDVRFMDRIFDNDVMTPMGRMVTNQMRAPDKRDALTVSEAQAHLNKVYAWLEERMTGREWAAGDAFSLADCAAAPSLFYADWAHPIPDGLRNLRAYRARLLARPSFARAVDEARPFRSYFPLGAPDRD